MQRSKKPLKSPGEMSAGKTKVIYIYTVSNLKRCHKCATVCAAGDFHHHCCFHQAHGWRKLMDEQEGVIKDLTPKRLSIHYKGSGPSVGGAEQYDEIMYNFAETQDVLDKSKQSASEVVGETS